MRSVFVTTLGCRLNQAESDALLAEAVRRGYRRATSATDADVHIVNSCSITDQGDADSRSAVRRAKRSNPATRVVLTGCYATVGGDAVAALDGVDALVPNDRKAALFDDIVEDGAPDVTIGALRRQPLSLSPSSVPSRSRAYLRIQDGCDYKCSFCIVPTARGPSRSLDIDTVRRQLIELRRAGNLEIGVTGVHIGTWGRDLTPRRNLVDLLRRLIPHLDGARLRLGSLDPHEVSDDLIVVMASHPEAICRHMHLPVQSGDRRVLAAMRRAHSVDDLRRTVGRAVERIPGVAIGSDVIVGFPGETDAEFANTVALLAELPMAYMHVFSYSRRLGTQAVSLPQHVEPRIRKSRNGVLRQLSQRKRRQFAGAFVGETLSAFVHRQRDRTTGALVGLTDNYIRVCFDGGDRLKGKWLPLQLDAVDDNGAVGRYVKST